MVSYGPRGGLSKDTLDATPAYLAGGHLVQEVALADEVVRELAALQRFVHDGQGATQRGPGAPFAQAGVLEREGEGPS